MKKITKTELATIIKASNGAATFISVDIETDPRMTKSNNPYVGAIKRVTLNGVINFDYTNSVNNQLQREGKDTDFVSKPRVWGTWDGNLITHNGEYYLNMKVDSSSDSIYVFNGTAIDSTLVKPFLPKSSKPHTQAELDKEVVVRDVKFDSIKKIRAFGEEYVIV